MPTLVLLKPDAVARGLTFEISERFEKRGLPLVACKMLQPTREQAAAHYKPLEKTSDFAALVDFLVSGPAVVLVDAEPAAVQALAGDADPAKALRLDRRPRGRPRATCSSARRRRRTRSARWRCGASRRSRRRRRRPAAGATPAAARRPPRPAGGGDGGGSDGKSKKALAKEAKAEKAAKRRSTRRPGSPSAGRRRAPASPR